MDKLEKSPGYFGWIAVNKGGREAQSFVVYPEVSRKVMAVIVIHENRGSKERSTTALDSADPLPTFFLEPLKSGIHVTPTCHVIADL
jgi:hypothetical protein